MSIDIEPRDLGSVVQLAVKAEGWALKDTRYTLKPMYIGGNPNPPIVNCTPENLIRPLQQAWLTTQERRTNDSNGLKAAVLRLAVIDGILITDAVITDYFTAWGLPKSDTSIALFEEHEKEVVKNRAYAPNALYETTVPWAVCSHNVLLDSNGDILMMVRAQSQGFQAGRVSVTQEEQMEPTLDSSPFNAAFRSFHEELNLLVPPQTIRLLGVALEKGAAYPAFCFIAEVGKVAKDIVSDWQKARDYNENTALFAVGMADVDKWLKDAEIDPDVWHDNFLAGKISPDAKLKFHATSPWRLNLARMYLAKKNYI